MSRYLLAKVGFTALTIFGLGIIDTKSAHGAVVGFVNNPTGNSSDWSNFYYL